jgi:hypothetical protein
MGSQVNSNLPTVGSCYQRIPVFHIFCTVWYMNQPPRWKTLAASHPRVCAPSQHPLCSLLLQSPQWTATSGRPRRRRAGGHGAAPRERPWRRRREGCHAVARGRPRRQRRTGGHGRGGGTRVATAATSGQQRRDDELRPPGSRTPHHREKEIRREGLPFPCMC